MSIRSATPWREDWHIDETMRCSTDAPEGVMLVRSVIRTERLRPDVVPGTARIGAVR